MKLKKFFKNKTVIVTGHTGFKGSWLTVWLHIMGAKVIGLSLNIPSNPSHFKSSCINSYAINKKVDIRNLRKLKKIFKKYQPDYVFHLAALADIVPSIDNPEKYYRSNVTGTLNVLQAVKKFKVKKLIYSASSSCYGIPKKYPTKETEKINPIFPYAVTKYLG